MTPERRQDGRSSSAPGYGIPRCEPGSPGTRMARYCDTNPNDNHHRQTRRPGLLLTSPQWATSGRRNSTASRFI
jgi:hypothetical protein